jgi:hypothetical protein
LNLAEKVALFNFVALFRGWREVPFFLGIQAGNINASRNIVTRLILDSKQRSLNPIIEIGNDPWAKLN